MRMGLIVLVVLLGAAIFAALNSFFIVNPAQQALVLQFGQVKQAVREPGLNLKIPLIQDTLYIDKRVLDLNVPAQEIIAADQKRLVVDAFMRYRVANPVRFYQAAQTVTQGETILATRVVGAMRAVLGEATFEDIVRDDRPELMSRISNRVSTSARELGVEVVDVRLRRADLPEANSEAIYARMQTERQQEAREIRAQGEEAARRITAAADRTATVLRAEAERESLQIRGQGDGQQNAIFADAYSRDPQFFAFYRAMQAYEEGLSSQDTRLVLSPDADFFRYFNDPLGTTFAGDTRTPAPADGTTPLPSLPAAAPAQTPAEGEEASEADVTMQDTVGTPAATPASADATLLTPISEGSETASTADVGRTPEQSSTAAAVASADPAPSPEADAAANRAVPTPVDSDAAPLDDSAGTPEASLADEANAADPAEASVEAAVISAEPAPSSTANAVAQGGSDAEADPRIGEVQRGRVTIVRPESAIE